MIKSIFTNIILNEREREEGEKKKYIHLFKRNQQCMTIHHLNILEINDDI